MKVHVVTPGETLHSVAERYGVSHADIIAANLSLSNAGALPAGQTVYVPAKAGLSIRPEAIAAGVGLVGGLVLLFLLPSPSRRKNPGRKGKKLRTVSLSKYMSIANAVGTGIALSRRYR